MIAKIQRKKKLYIKSENCKLKVQVQDKKASPSEQGQPFQNVRYRCFMAYPHVVT